MKRITKGHAKKALKRAGRPISKKAGKDELTPYEERRLRQNALDQIRSSVSPERPRVFIGSSSEGLNLARAIQSESEQVAVCTIWNQGIFEIGKATLANLYGFLDSFDFAIFVATPDDNIDVRGVTHTTARDNVIFEIGLFMGGLGVDRVIFVAAGK